MKIIKPIGFSKPKQEHVRFNFKSKSQNKKNKIKNIRCVKQESSRILLQEKNKNKTKL